MSKTRKILSIVLAVVMAFGVFSICAFADTDTATWTVEVTNTDGTALGATIAPGDKVLVTVKLQTNFYVGTIGLPVIFSDAFEYAGNLNQVAIYGSGADHNAFNDDYDINIPSGTNAVYAIYVPNSGAAGATAPKYTTATTILSFELEATQEGTADIYLPASWQKTTDGTLGGVSGRFYIGSHTSSSVASDEVNVNNAFVTTNASAQVVISAAVVTPVLTGVNGGYVDDVNGYVYGIPIGEDAADYFTVQNGSLAVSATVTGGTLTVYDNSSNVYATYTVIIFGDADGSGDITLLDDTIIYNATNGAAISDPAYAFAADVDGSGDITLLDETIIYNATNGATVTVNPYAA